jgi:hypothetical protein
MPYIPYIMKELKILIDAFNVKFSDWVEWKLRHIPRVVTIMYGTDYSLITSPATSTSNSYDALWPHTWTDDIATTRTPLLAFELIYSDNFTPPSWFGLYGFSVLFWIELVAIQLIICLLAALPIAILMYYIIIKPQKCGNEQQSHESVPTKKKQTIRTSTSTFGLIFGWFVLLPIWIALPSPMATAFGIENSIHRFFVCGTTPTIAIFRTLEAMYGFAPARSITSVYKYALYFTSPLLLLPKSDFKVRQHQRSEWLTLLYYQAVSFVTGLLITGMYQSYIREVLPYGKGSTSTPSNLYTWSSLLDLQLWYETISYAFLLQLYLSTCSAGLATSTMILTGHPTQPISDAPLQHCSSPSDFWGRRWNNLIHTCLKNGVFKPIRSLGGHTVLAVVATFIASGLFHEWLLPSTMTDYPHTHGLAITFFLWNAMLVAIEMMIGARMGRWFADIAPYVPRPFITMAVISLGLPVGHWFIDSYMRSGFFKHGQFLFPMILAIPGPSDTHSSIPTLFSFSI